jgi:putative membrane protein
VTSVDPADSPAPPDPVPAKLTERPHPLTPLIRAWVVLLALLIGGAREVFSWFTEGRNLPSITFLVGALTIIVVVAVGVGLVSWLTTRFVIDTDELRIESGILVRKSQRIAFDKVTSIDVVQPLAARMFALAELEIDTGSAERIKLRYLTRARSYSLRDFLLSRARGHHAVVTATADPGLRLDDLSEDDQVLVRIAPDQLVKGALTSNEFVWLVITIIATLVAAVLAVPYFGGWFLVIALGIPAVSGLFGFVVRRFTGQFNFTLSVRPAGLRISRGLTSLTSQSLPPRRIQTVRLTQSLLWRWPGWYRAEIDVLGMGIHNEEGVSAGVSSVLLPVATIQQLRLVLAEVWPLADWEKVVLHKAPWRAHGIHPLSAPFLAIGHDELLVVSRHGWLERRWDLIPHARVQSIRISQGPVSRRLRVANLDIHTGGSRFTPRALGLDADHVRDRQDELIALAQAHRSDITVDAHGHLGVEHAPADQESAGRGDTSPHSDRTAEPQDTP